MNNEIKKITIIMPVYNTGIYLQEAILSIKNQTFVDWELLCVDDGSTDELTIDILQKAKDSDRRINVLNCLHKGAAVSRNIGLEHAKGDYVLFLDADDIFESEMLEDMYTRIKAKDAEICVCGYRKFFINDGKNIVSETFIPTKHLENIKYNELYLKSEGIVPWNRLCKKEFLIENQILFQDLSSSNDIYFSMIILLLAQKVVNTEDKIYVNYRTKINTQISANRNPMNTWSAIEFLINDVKKRSIWNEIIRKQLFAVLLACGVYELRICKKNEKYYQFYTTVQTILLNEELTFEDLHTNNLYLYWKTKPIESKWIDEIGDFDKQLEINEEKLMLLLSDKNSILLWGYGKRGQAFERWAHKKLRNIVIYDKYINRNQTDYGNHIESDINIIDKIDVIIASNTSICKEAQDKFCYLKDNVINLEIFCPM